MKSATAKKTSPNSSVCWKICEREALSCRQTASPLLNDRITGESRMNMTRSEFGKVEVDIVYCVP